MWLLTVAATAGASGPISAQWTPQWSGEEGLMFGFWMTAAEDASTGASVLLGMRTDDFFMKQSVLISANGCPELAPSWADGGELACRWLFLSLVFNA